MKTLFDPDERKRRKNEADRLRNRKHCDRETYEQQAHARREQAQALRAQGLTYKQIATYMDTTADAIDKLLRKARAESLTR